MMPKCSLEITIPPALKYLCAIYSSSNANRIGVLVTNTGKALYGKHSVYIIKNKSFMQVL